jgi:hypothetical protein
MERVVVLTGSSFLAAKNEREINDYLNKGWKVKHVTSTATDGWVTVVFVLEHDDE